MGKTFESMKDKYTSLLSGMEIKPSWNVRASSQAKRIYANRARYEKIASNFGTMPWEFVGIIHMLEGNLNFNTHLHNGDSLNGRTHNEPKGYPKHGVPPFTWEESAIDALKIKGLDAEGIEWNDERMCYEWERYNGFGYANINKLSPYLWSGSTLYTSGKYVKDHVYDPKAVSEQVGAVVLLSAIREAFKDEEVKQVKKVSRRFIFLKNFKQFLGSLGVLSYLSWDNLNQVKGFVNDHLGLIILAVCVIMWLGFKYLDFLSTREIKEGRYTSSKLSKEE